MSRRISVLPKWTYHLTTSYPGSFNAHIKVDCVKSGTFSRFTMTKVGGIYTHEEEGCISRGEKIKLEAHCVKVLQGSLSLKNWDVCFYRRRFVHWKTWSSQKNRDSAEKRANIWRRVNHDWHCVKKEVDIPEGVECLCVSSKGEQECVFHHYARTVRSHSLEECTLGEVTVEEIDIY